MIVRTAISIGKSVGGAALEFGKTLGKSATNKISVRTSGKKLFTESEEKIKEIMTTYYDERKVELRGLYGAPPIFSENADLRTDNNKYGLKWSDTYLKWGNICAIEVGRPISVGGIGGNLKDALETFINAKDEGLSKGQKEEIWDTVSKTKRPRLVSFKRDMNAYYNYVDLTALYFQRMYGIAPSKTELLFTGTKKHSNGFTVGPSYRSAPDKYISEIAQHPYEGGGDASKVLWNFVSFYHDGPIETGYTMNNSTRESQMFSALNDNPMKEKAQEFSFLTGANIASMVSDGDSVTTEGTWGKLKSAIGGTVKGAVGLAGKAAGAVIMAPQIYSGSDTEKSVDLKITLLDPYANPYSNFRNIALPLAHLIPLAYPTQVGSEDLMDGVPVMGSYGPPMVVRFYARGAEQIQLGIVTNITIKKDPTMMTPTGLCKRVEVFLSIKDLYGIVGLPSVPKASALRHSIGFNEMISSLAGVSMIENELHENIIDRTIDDWTMNLARTYSTLGSRMSTGIKDFGSNILTIRIAKPGG